MTGGGERGCRAGWAPVAAEGGQAFMQCTSTRKALCLLPPQPTRSSSRWHTTNLMMWCRPSPSMAAWSSTAGSKRCTACTCARAEGAGGKGAAERASRQARRSSGLQPCHVQQGAVCCVGRQARGQASAPCQTACAACTSAGLPCRGRRTRRAQAHSAAAPANAPTPSAAAERCPQLGQRRPAGATATAASTAGGTRGGGQGRGGWAVL